MLTQCNGTLQIKFVTAYGIMVDLEIYPVFVPSVLLSED
jgi:hypothetical protein